MQDVFNVLIVIDVQREFRDQNGMYEKCLEFINTHFNDYYVLGTVWKNFDDSMYERHLNFSKCKDVDFAYASSSSIEYPADHLILKTGYGINSGLDFNRAISDIIVIAAEKQYRAYPNIKYHIIGCDADACVMATAFYLWDRGDDFKIFTDYIYTTDNDGKLEEALRILRRNFGDIATLSTGEQV